MTTTVSPADLRVAVNNLAARVQAAPGGTITLSGSQVGQALSNPPQVPWADVQIRRGLKYNGVTVTKQRGWLGEKYTFTAHEGGLQRLGIAEDDYLEIAAQGLMQCVIAIGMAGKTAGIRVGPLFQAHLMELFRRFSAPDGIVLSDAVTSRVEGARPTKASFELWRETYGAYFSMAGISFEEFVAGVAQTNLRYDLSTPPDYLSAVAQVNAELAMMLVRGLAEILTAFVVTGPSTANRIGALDDYKERWFNVSAAALGVRYENGQFLD